MAVLCKLACSLARRPPLLCNFYDLMLLNLYLKMKQTGNNCTLPQGFPVSFTTGQLFVCSRLALNNSLMPQGKFNIFLIKGNVRLV